VQVILASRIDRLPTDEKDLLQNLAVMGKEFPLALVKNVTDKSDDELDRMLADLQVGEFIYEQPALPDVEYTFKHSLTLEVAYNSVLMERRKHLHERTGAALETLYANSLADHLDELAHHYSRSDNLAKAVEYLGRAGQHALQRSAYVEAISHLTAGIDLLQRVPDSRERLQRELPLQLAVGPALIAVKGWAAAETERAYVRARQLCDRLGNSPELFPVLFGLWASYLVRGELRMASELAEQLLRLADSANDPALRLYAQTALGHTSFWMAEFFPAREYLESAISIYEPERHRPLALRYLGVDAWVYCLSGAALTLWELGYPAQALKQGNEGIALAQRLSHPQSLALAETFVCMLRQYRREVHAAQANAESVIALSAERGITNFATATSLRGWAIAGQGRHEEGIAQIQEGLAMWGAQGAGLARPVILSMLAERCMEAGRLDEGLNALKEALAVANEHEIRHYEVETHRLKGELLLRQHDSNVAEARGCFERAIEIARKQSAKSLELRATMGLAQLVAKQGKPDEARKMLADVYNWFTEGFDTADLKDAKALLDELGE
jgi:predicted ATPase